MNPRVAQRDTTISLIVIEGLREKFRNGGPGAAGVEPLALGDDGFGLFYCLAAGLSHDGAALPVEEQMRRKIDAVVALIAVTLNTFIGLVFLAKA